MRFTKHQTKGKNLVKKTFAILAGIYIAASILGYFILPSVTTKGPSGSESKNALVVYCDGSIDAIILPLKMMGRQWTEQTIHAKKETVESQRKYDYGFFGAILAWFAIVNFFCNRQKTGPPA